LPVSVRATLVKVLLADTLAYAQQTRRPTPWCPRSWPDRNKAGTNASRDRSARAHSVLRSQVRCGRTEPIARLGDGRLAWRAPARSLEAQKCSLVSAVGRRRKFRFHPRQGFARPKSGHKTAIQRCCTVASRHVDRILAVCASCNQTGVGLNATAPWQRELPHSS
jgi:hypothetical protein